MVGSMGGDLAGVHPYVCLFVAISTNNQEILFFFFLLFFAFLFFLIPRLSRRIMSSCKPSSERVYPLLWKLALFLGQFSSECIFTRANQ